MRWLRQKVKMRTCEKDETESKDENMKTFSRDEHLQQLKTTFRETARQSERVRQKQE
jgi:hypothetical protein